jgi:hypothetical protein
MPTRSEAETVALWFAIGAALGLFAGIIVGTFAR